MDGGGLHGKGIYAVCGVENLKRNPSVYHLLVKLRKLGVCLCLSCIIYVVELRL